MCLKALCLRKATSVPFFPRGFEAAAGPAVASAEGFRRAEECPLRSGIGQRRRRNCRNFSAWQLRSDVTAARRAFMCALSSRPRSARARRARPRKTLGGLPQNERRKAQIYRSPFRLNFNSDETAVVTHMCACTTTDDEDERRTTQGGCQSRSYMAARSTPSIRWADTSPVAWPRWQGGVWRCTLRAAAARC